MDEGLLNDLLECSVCLERLDTSSRVLPCQHTFCLKCLKVIVESHKELRCPECRILVEAKVEELPPNVLLMRILEGMRNNVPRKLMPAQRTNRHAQGGAGAAAGRDKPLPPHGRALYDFISKEPGDLSFKKGDTVLLQKRLDAFWYQGESGGRAGLFPITYLQVVVPLPAPTALCKALYDFRMSAPDEEGCLAFDKGAIITVHRRVDENWAEGRLEQRVGIFPIAFVELNQPARLLINSAPLNRPAPPAPPALAQHAAHAQHSHRYQPMSLSTPAGGTYASPGGGHMSQSQPAYHAQPQSLPGPGSPRAILEPHTKHAPDLIHFGVHGHPGSGGALLQSVSRADERLRLKCEYAPPDTYANVRADLPPPSSDSSSGAATSASSAGTPPSSGPSDDSAEPSLPSSPDEPRLDASMGVLSLNESSTATNTALNVSLPPAESPRPDGPAASSSKPDRPSGPDSLLTFGLGLQAALSPAHGKDGYAARTHRDHHHREKRHSLTPSSHLQPNHSTQNRHSAEILATSLLDGVGVGDTEARRRRSRSGERALPALYVALYPYRPQKPDELDLKKGAMYVVTERCRDGWYKGRSERSQRAGVFPGNYVARAKHDKQQAPASVARTAGPAPGPVAAVAGTGGPGPAGPAGTPAPPDAPPRAHSPAAGQPLSYPWSSGVQSQTQQSTPRSDKSKDKKSEKSISTGVSLMKRLAAMKKCKSPPPAAGYSLDNPVFDDSCSTARLQPQHVRSGSCPSQLLRALPGAASPAGAERRHKERLLHDHRRVTGEGPWQSQHRKSQSLDVTATRRERHHAQPVKERFRCVVPYPPNSEYELELQLDDIVLVSRKRGDGWYKGTLQRTGRSGLFPASFVQPAPP